MKRFRFNKTIAILAIVCLAALVLTVVAACAPKLDDEVRTVTFHNGDEVFDQQTVPLGEKYVFPQNEPTREQPDDDHLYQFIGWTLDPNFYEYRSEIITEPDFVVASLDIYAAYRLVEIDDSQGGYENLSYKVEFRMPEGEDFGEWSGKTLEQFTQTIKRGGNADIPEADSLPQIEGYTFADEWTGGTLQNVRGNRRVTAVYKKNVYRYTWHYLGETTSRQAEFRTPVDLAEQPQTNDVFVFDGWYMDENFQTEATLTEIPSHDVDLYAKYHVDFSTASVSHEGSMIYGDIRNTIYVSGLKDCDGLNYTFVWTINGVAEQPSDVRFREVKNAGDYNLSVHISADYRNGVLQDQAFAKNEQGSEQFVYTLRKATLSAQVTLSADSVVYGSAAPEASIVYSGFVFDETAESVGVDQDFVVMQGETDLTDANLHVGSYRVETIPHELSNYDFAEISAPAFAVTKKDLKVSATLAEDLLADYTYGDLFAFEVAFDGFVDEFGDDEKVLGEHWFTLDNDSQTKYVGQELFHAGSHTVRLNGYASDDYNVILPDAIDFNVAKRDASAQLSAQGGLYGTTPQITFAFTDVLPQDEARFVPSYTYKRQGNAYSNVNRFVVGSYTVDGSFEERGYSDYNTLVVTGAQFNIDKKPLIVGVAVNDSYVYGDKISPSPVYEEAFEFGESAQTEGLVQGSLRYVYSTAAGDSYPYATFSVNNYNVQAEGITADNYQFTFLPKAFAVTKKALVLTVHLRQNSVLYGTTPQVATGDDLINGISYDGFVLNDTARSVFGNSNLPKVFYLNDKGERTTTFHSGSYTATTEADPQNYSVSVTTAALTVNKRTLFVGIVLLQQSLVYGSKPTATPTYKQDGFNGFVDGEEALFASHTDIRYTGAESYLQSDLASATVKMVAGSYTLSVVGLSDDVTTDYIVTYAHEQEDIGFEITPMAVNVTLTSTATYTYGATPRIYVSYGKFAYNETAQDLFGENATKAVFMQQGKPVQIERYINAGSYTATLSGITNPNYTFTINTCDFQVLPKALTVTVSADNFTYGDRALPQTSLSYNGFVEGENEHVLGGEVQYAYTRDGSEYTSQFFDAGSYKVSVKGYISSNYAISYKDDSFVVAKRNFSVTVTAQGCTYGQQPQYNYTSTVLDRDSESFGFAFALTFSRSTSNFQNYDVNAYQRFQAGNYRVTVTYTLNDNYNSFTVAPVSFNVARKTLELSASAEGFVYGGEPQPTFTQKGLENGDESLLEGVTFGYSGSNLLGGVFHVGSYQVYINNITSNNYNINYTNGNFSVTPASLTVTVSTTNFTYGQRSTPTFTLGYEGFQHSDKASNLSGKVVYSYKRGDEASSEKQPYTQTTRFVAGHYEVSANGLVSNDYDITFVGCTLVVAKANLTVTVSATDFQYDGTTQPKPTLEYSGFVFSEDSKVLNGSANYSYAKGNVPYTDSVFHAGSYNVAVSGFTSDNYNISYVGGSFDVTKRNVTLTFGNVWSTYADDPQQYNWCTLNGDEILNNELNFAVSFTKDGKAYEQNEPFFSVGTYVLTVSYAENSDYAVRCNGAEVHGSATRAEFTIKQKELTLGLQDTSKWSERENWSDTPTISDNRFTIVGEIGLANAKDAAAKQYSVEGSSLGSEFAWKSELKINYNGQDVTSNFKFNYSISIMLDNSSFSVELPKNLTFTFDGTEHTFVVKATADGISAEEITITYNYDGKTEQSQVSIRDYLEGSHEVSYTVHAENATDSTGTFIVTVNRAKISVTKPSDVKATYQKGQNRFVALVANTNFSGAKDDSKFAAKVTYSKDSTDFDKDSLGIINVKDSGVVNFRIDAGSNYEVATGSYNVAIGKATVTLPTIGSKTYNGSNQTAEVPQDSRYKVTENDGGSAAGSYDVKLDLTDRDNYQWSTESSDTQTLKFIIDRAQLVKPTAANKSYTYNAQSQQYELEGFAEETMSVEGNFQTAANESGYTVTVSIADTNNYVWTDGTQTELEFTFVIAKANYKVDVPQNINVVYDSELHGNKVTFGGVEGETNLGKAVVSYTPDSQSQGSAEYPQYRDYRDGGYTVNYTVDGNDNYNKATGSYTITIQKTTPTITLPEQNRKSTYDRQNKNSALQKAIEYTNKYNDAVIQYALEVIPPEQISLAADLVWVDSIDQITITDAGRYKLHVQVSGNNYVTAEQTFEITIAKAQSTLDVRGVKTQYTYTGKEQTVNSGATTNNTDDYKITYTNNTFTKVPSGGTQKVTVSIAETANYLGTTADVTIHVAKEKASINTDGITTVYDYNAQQHTINSGAKAVGLDGVTLDGIGNITYSNNTFTNVPSGGKFQLTVTLSEGDNYLGTEKSVEITVNKANYDLKKVVDDAATYTFNAQPQGRSLEALKALIGVYENDAFQVEFVGDGQPTNAGTHTVKFAVSGNANYNDIESSYRVTIGKANITVDAVSVTETYAPNTNRFVSLAGKVHGVDGDDAFEPIITYGKESENRKLATIDDLIDAGETTVYYKVVAGSNYEEKTGSYNVKINPKQVTVTLTKGTGGTYNGNEYGGDAAVSFEGVLGGEQCYESIKFEVQTPSYSGDTRPTFVNAGSYVVNVTIVPTANYTFGGVDGNYKGTYTVTINKAKLSVNTERYTKEITYDGADHFGGITKDMITGLAPKDSFTVTYAMEEAGSDYGNAWIIDDVNDSHDVWFKIDAGENYEVLSGNYHITINKADLPAGKRPATPQVQGVVEGVLVRKQGQTLDGLCKLGENWKWSDGTDTNSELINGSYAFRAIYTDPSGNYLDYEVQISFTTRKENVTVQQIDDNTTIDFNFGATVDKNVAQGKFKLVGEDGRIIDENLTNVTLALTGYNGSIGSTYRGQATFTIVENNYYTFDTTSFDVYIKVKSVDVDGTLYTIEDALNTAQSGKTVTVKNNTAFAEKSVATAVYDDINYYTVKNGVTLLLPYAAQQEDSDKDNGGNNQSYISGVTPGSYVATKFLTLTIVSGIELKNNGTITIGAITGAANTGTTQGAISAGYSEIVLNGKIENYGTINAYGNISGNGEIISYENSTVRERMEILDWRGGTIAASVFLPDGTKINAFSLLGDDYTPEQAHLFPFKQYNVVSITSKLTINYGATWSGIVRIWTNDIENPITGGVAVSARFTTVDFVLASKKGDAQGLFQLEPGATLTKQRNGARTKITVSGGAVGGQANLEVSAGANFKLQSGITAFPIDGDIDIVLEDGIYSSGYGYRLLPGATLKICKGSRNVETKLTLTNSDKGYLIYNEDDIVYADNTNPANATNGKWELYPKGRGNAQFIVGVNCTLEVSGKLGGTILGEDGAKIIFSNSAVLTSTIEEGWGDKARGSGLSSLTYTFSFYATTMKEKQAQGKLLNGDGAFTQGQTYYYKNNTWLTKTALKVTYNAQGGNINGQESYTQTLSDYTDWQRTEVTLNNGDLELPIPTRAYYTFLGWSQKQNGGESDIVIGADGTFKQAINFIIGENNTLYAVWKPIQYTINYEVEVAVSGTAMGTLCIWDITQGEILLSELLPVQGAANTQFDGWYTSKYQGTIDALNKDNAQEIFKGGTTITVYGRFEASFTAKVVYDIGEMSNVEGYHNLANEMPMDQTIVSGKQVNSIAMPSESQFATVDNNVKLKKYFVGWKIKTANGDLVDITDGTTVGSGICTLSGSEYTLTLVAQWADKVTLTVTVTATGTKGSSGWKNGEDRKASASVTFSNYDTPLSESVTGYGGAGHLIGGSDGSTETKQITAYLRPGQTYEVTAKEGSVTSGQAQGTAGNSDIYVTVSNS